MNANSICAKVTKTPTYINALTKVDEEITLVYKVSEPLLDITTSSINSIKNGSLDRSLDITGSPLKVDLDNSALFCVDIHDATVNFWKKEEETHSPLTYDEACKYIRKNAKNSKHLPIWCICDATDEEKTILLSSQQTFDSIATCRVISKGYLPKNHSRIEFTTMSNLFFDSFADLTGEKQKIPLRQIATNVSSIYELHETKMDTKLSESMEPLKSLKGSVYVEVQWDIHTVDIPLDNSKCNMTIRTVVGEEQSFVSSFWKSLIFIEMYVNTLNACDTEPIGNNHLLPNAGEICDDLHLIESVIEILNDTKNDIPQLNNPDKIQFVPIIENVNNRENFDVTDQLWNVLKRCSTYGVLTDCLNAVFMEIANDNTLDIYIANSNITIMADIIRGIKDGKLTVPRLMGTQPIEMLIDIGLEKLWKDFVYIFTKCGIMNSYELNNLLRDLKLNDKSDSEKKKFRTNLYQAKSVIDLENISNRMKILGQLHTILETILLIPEELQLRFAKNIYGFYIGNECPFNSFTVLAKQKLFEISLELPINDIYEYIIRLNPVIWRLSMTLKLSSFSLQCVHHLAQRPIFPPSIYNLASLDGFADNGSITNEEEEVRYHYTLMRRAITYVKSS